MVAQSRAKEGHRPHSLEMGKEEEYGVHGLCILEGSKL